MKYLIILLLFTNSLLAQYYSHTGVSLYNNGDNSVSTGVLFHIGYKHTFNKKVDNNWASHAGFRLGYMDRLIRESIVRTNLIGLTFDISDESTYYLGVFADYAWHYQEFNIGLQGSKNIVQDFIIPDLNLNFQFTSGFVGNTFYITPCLGFKYNIYGKRKERPNQGTSERRFFKT